MNFTHTFSLAYTTDDDEEGLLWCIPNHVRSNTNRITTPLYPSRLVSTIGRGQSGVEAFPLWWCAV